MFTKARDGPIGNLILLVTLNIERKIVMTDQELIEYEKRPKFEDAPYDVRVFRYLAVIYMRKVKTEDQEQEKSEIMVECGLQQDVSENITPVIRLSKDCHPEFIEDGKDQYVTDNDVMTIAEYSWFSDVERNYSEFDGCRDLFNKVAKENDFPISAKEELKTKRSIYEDPEFRDIKLSTLKVAVEWGNDLPEPSDDGYEF